MPRRRAAGMIVRRCASSSRPASATFPESSAGPSCRSTSSRASSPRAGTTARSSRRWGTARRACVTASGASSRALGGRAARDLANGYATHRALRGDVRAALAERLREARPDVVLAWNAQAGALVTDAAAAGVRSILWLPDLTPRPEVDASPPPPEVAARGGVRVRRRSDAGAARAPRRGAPPARAPRALPGRDPPARARHAGEPPAREGPGRRAGRRDAAPLAEVPLRRAPGIPSEARARRSGPRCPRTATSRSSGRAPTCATSTGARRSCSSPPSARTPARASSSRPRRTGSPSSRARWGGSRR